MPRWKLRSWLFALVAATALPCLAVFLWLSAANVRHDREEAATDAWEVATRVAAKVDQEVEQSRRILEVLVRRPQVKSLRAGDCDPLLRDFAALNPKYVTVFTVDARGDIVCSSIDRTPRFSYADRAWFRSALSGGGFVVGDAVFGRSSRRWLLPVALPIPALGGGIAGVAVLSIDLVRLGPDLEPQSASPTRISLFDLRGTMLARTVDPASWVGRNFLHRRYVAKAIAEPQSRSYVDRDLSGDDRIFGIASALDGRWRVMASLSERSVLGPVRARRTAAATLGILIGAFAVALGAFLNRRLVRPIRELAEAARAGGASIVQAPVYGPRELREAIERFNELQHTRAQAEKGLRESGERVARLNRFLRTRWSVSQLIARESGPEPLLAGACAILVEQAELPGSWIGFADRATGEVKPLAWAGVEREDVAWVRCDESPEGSGPFGRAIRSGEHQVAQDAKLEPTLQLPRSVIHRLPLRSAAAFPLRKREVVVGALVVYSGSTQAFDSEIVELLDELARELGRALDHFDEIEERRSAEAALRRSEARLVVSDRLASVGRLAAAVAHEINNPLAYVMMNTTFALEELQRGGADSRPGVEPAIEALQEARLGCERVRVIVRDLKLFSRAEAPARSPLDVRAVIESSVNIAWNEIRHRARLVKELPPLPPVVASESRLGQVFLNLLVNAAQAIEPGHANDNVIRIHARAQQRRVIVEVTDTGAGIAPELHQRIFDPFFTTKPAGVGTGLGLAVCQSIIAELGGDIQAESAPGRGSTFRVILPAADVAPPGPLPATPAAPPRPLPRSRILVVDDEAAVGNALRRSLGREQEVVCSTRAQEALQRLKDGERFDVILCDLMMPEMTGMDLYAEVQRLDPELARRMILMTGGTFTPGAQAFFDAVPNPRLEKPFDLQRLREVLRTVIA